MLARFFAIPNGGHRTKTTALKLKAEGVKKGVLDTHLPVARRGYNGLWIEFKTGRNRLTAEQAEWKDFLEGEGYQVIVAYTWMEAARGVVQYLSLTNHTPIPSVT